MRSSIAASRKIAVGVALVALTSVTPGAAMAEGGLFGAIITMFSRAIAPQPPPSEPQSHQAPHLGSGYRTAERPESGGSWISYCVRTCDGRYFPIAKNGETTPARMCHAMCPAAETEIYSGSNIESSVSQKGNRYASLANAYLYRDKMVEGCSCNSKSPLGTVSISYQNDPTLRPGDIVMTENGPVVFKGATGPTHKLSDFTPVKDSKRISGSVREKVIAMKVMPTRQASTQTRKKAQPTQNTSEILKSIPEGQSRALGFAE